MTRASLLFHLLLLLSLYAFSVDAFIASLTRNALRRPRRQLKYEVVQSPLSSLSVHEDNLERDGGEGGEEESRRVESLSRSVLMRRVMAGLATIGVLSVNGVGTAEASGFGGTLTEVADLPGTLQHLVVNVPDVDAAVKFCEQSLYMRRLRERGGKGKGDPRTVFVGYGPETFDAKKLDGVFVPGISSSFQYGGHISLELVERKEVSLKTDDPDVEPVMEILDPGTTVTHLRLSLPQIRASKLEAAGAKVGDMQGFVPLTAPFGLPMRVVIGQARDPVTYLGLKCNDLTKSLEFYKSLGMREFPFPHVRVKYPTIFEPEPPTGSIFVSYGEGLFGLLLEPNTSPDPVKPGKILDKIALVSSDVINKGKEMGAKFAGKVPGPGTRVAVLDDPDGNGVVLVEYDDFEKELSKPGFLDFSPSWIIKTEGGEIV